MKEYFRVTLLCRDAIFDGKLAELRKLLQLDINGIGLLDLESKNLIIK